MAKVRVPVAGTVGKSVLIDTDAPAQITAAAEAGATIGVNFKLPDGSTPSLVELAAALQAERRFPFTFWNRILEVPPVLASLDALVDPNTNSVLYWDDTAGALDFANFVFIDEVASLMSISGALAVTGAITASHFGGIQSANLVSKIATETISGQWSFTHNNGPVITNAQPEIYWRETGVSADEGNWIFRASAGDFFFGTATDAAPTAAAQSFLFFVRNGSSLSNIEVRGGTDFHVRDGGSVFIKDTGDTDWLEMSHDTVDFNFTFVNTADLNITGLTGVISIEDGIDIAVGTTGGTVIATAASQLLGFFGATAIVQQTTTSQTPATFTANSSGIVDDTATWDGYTIGDLVAILRAFGFLA